MIVIICIIPARGGSQRVLRKNIRDFCGKPLIARTIEQAIESRCFTNVIVSTEDEEIKEISFKYGAEVVDQPGASNNSKSEDAIKYVLSLYPETDSFMLLQCTSPLRTTKDIQFVKNYIMDKLKFNSVVSVYLKDDCYKFNGAIYARNTKDFLERGLYDNETFLYIMAEEISIDIDTECDWEQAEIIAKNYGLGEYIPGV